MLDTNWLAEQIRALYLWPQRPPSPLGGHMLLRPPRQKAGCGFPNALLSTSPSLPGVPLPRAGEPPHASVASLEAPVPLTPPFISPP